MEYLRHYILILNIVMIFTPITSQTLHEKMVVTSLAANLRSVPRNIPSNFKLPASSKTNPFQVTQLLYNEYVIAKEKYIDQKNNSWYLVEAVQQLYKNKHGQWSGITGWVQGKDLTKIKNFEQRNIVITSLFAHIYNDAKQKIGTVCIGTEFTGTWDSEKNMYQIILPEQCCGWIKEFDITIISQKNIPTENQIRSNIIKTAQKFLGNLYSWGSRTPQTDLLPVSSVDCSSLITLIFASQGLLVPRNSTSQYSKAIHIKHGKHLQPGDLIFFANDKHKINHVILYIGNGNILESSLTAGKVVQSSFKNRIGVDHTTMKSGDLSGPIQTLESENPVFFKIYFASFLSDHGMIRKLRHEFLRHNY